MTDLLAAALALFALAGLVAAHLEIRRLRKRLHTVEAVAARLHARLKRR